MSDEHLPEPTSGQRIMQLALFEILDPNDAAYSQAIELYDLIPKYIRYRRKREFEKDNISVERKFTVHNRDYDLRIYGAIIEDRDDDAHIVYPGTREELIEDALRKITVSQGRAAYDEDGGFCKFTIYELQSELKAMGHFYSNTEIKEALNILHQTRIAVEADGKKVTSGYLLPFLSFVSEDDLRLDRDAKCIVRFHEIVSLSIKQLEFRQFNYAMSMSFSSSLTRSLFKRLSQRWRQASMVNSYSLGMITMLRDAGEPIDTKMHNNRKKVRKALDELVNKGVIRGYEEEPIRVGRRIVDVKLTFETGIRYTDQPTKSFTGDQKRANHFVGAQADVKAQRPTRPRA